MSIFGIDWNGDGNIDFADTAVDAMLIDEMEENASDAGSNADDSDVRFSPGYMNYLKNKFK